MCDNSGISVVKHENMSDRVCFTCGRKVRDYCSMSTLLLKSINAARKSSEDETEERSKRQIPTTLEHSPTIRKQPKPSAEAKENVKKQRNVKKSLFSEETSDRQGVGCEVNVSSVFNIHDDLLKADEKANTVSVVIKSSTGNVVVRHVKDAKAKSIVRNIACKNWKTAAFAIIKCESLTDELLNALNKQVSTEFKNFSKLDSILKGRTPEELAAYSNRLFLEKVRIHLPVWNACVRGSVGAKTSEKVEKQSHAIALARSVLARCRNPEMSALAYRISAILFHSGANYEDIVRLNRLGVCMSPSRMVNLQRQMGKSFDAKVLLWKNDAEKKLSALRFLEDISCSQLAREDSDMNLDKEIWLDIATVQQYKHYSQVGHQNCVEIMEATKTQLGECLYTDEVLLSAIQNLQNDDIPHFK